MHLKPEKVEITDKDKTEQQVDAALASPTIPDVPNSIIEEPEAEEVWTEVADDVFLLHETLKDVDDLRMQRQITVFLVEALGLQFDQFLKMNDAEIEDELRKMFAPTDAEIKAKLQDLLVPSQLSMLDKTDFDSNIINSLGNRFSSTRIKRAITAINQLGLREGLQKLKEVDPEISQELDDYIQKQEEKN